MFILTDIYSVIDKEKQTRSVTDKGDEGKDQSYPNATDGLVVPPSGK